MTDRDRVRIVTVVVFIFLVLTVVDVLTHDYHGAAWDGIVGMLFALSALLPNTWPGWWPRRRRRS